ncbi:MAG: hypothetical protein NTW18_02820 [Candidatus Omnitrophica bacterium]|nr:hypothetical protein [Candidatus Omnitrophota bacterium]
MAGGVSFIGGLISLGLTVWFVLFSILVLNKLDKIIILLDKNK